MAASSIGLVQQQQQQPCTFIAQAGGNAVAVDPELGMTPEFQKQFQQFLEGNVRTARSSVTPQRWYVAERQKSCLDKIETKKDPPSAPLHLVHRSLRFFAQLLGGVGRLKVNAHQVYSRQAHQIRPKNRQIIAARE